MDWDGVKIGEDGEIQVRGYLVMLGYCRDEAATAEVIAHCRGRIADYKVPRHVELVADFPGTSTNKIQRYLLQQDAAGRFEDEAAAAMGGSR